MSREYDILCTIRDLLTSRPDTEQTYQLSSTQPYIIDRKDRKYLYLYTRNQLILSIEDLGINSTSTTGWVDITFQQGMRLFATNQVNPVPVLVRATDNAIDPGPMPLSPSTPFHLVSANTDNATNIKASPGNLTGYTLSNTNASARWVKFYDKAIAPVPATDTALLKQSVQVPANATVIRVFPDGLEFLKGIGFATVVNIADNDDTAVGTNDLSIDLDYI